MQFIIVFPVVFIQVFLINLLEIMKIVRAFWINTFMNNKVFAILFVEEAVVTMRTAKDSRFRETIIFSW